MTKDSDDSPYGEAPRSRPRAPAKPHRRGASHPRKAAAHSKPHPTHKPHATHARHAPASAKPARSTKKRRRRGGKGTYRATDGLTSHPTSRNAYVETRAWLLKEHGPVCAYCGKKYNAKLMTLDHVAPRRGQTAYDRRDNLVLSCQDCNAKKRDLAPLAFLLGSRSRAVNLLKYGAHLSHGLLDLARALVPENERPVVETQSRKKWNAHLEDDESPYR